MRTSILLWSAASGLIVGVLADLVLAGLILLLVSLLPEGIARAADRFGRTALWLLLASIPLAFTALGFLEGRLKAQ